MRLLAAAALLSVTLALAGCGGSSSPSVAHLSTGKERGIDELGKRRLVV